MVYRLSWLAAIASIALALARLQLLLQPSETGLPWPSVMVASVTLGAVLTWAATGYRLRPISILAINGVAFSVAAIRITAPATTIFGLLPTTDTAPVMSEELAFATELIRFGSAPVVPVRGLVVVIALAFWVFGAAIAYGFAVKRPTIPMLLPVALYLQFATIDRAIDGIGWPLAFVAVVSLSLAAVRIDERRSATGRLRTRHNTVVPKTRFANPLAFGTAVVVSAITAATLISSVLPPGGLVNWRSRAGIGTGISGGVSYNLFVSTVQTDLLTLSEEPVFIAKVNEGVDPAELFWTLITLEEYDGTNWFPGNLPTRRPDTTSWERADHSYQGAIQVVDQVVRIETLRQNYLPSVTTASDLISEDQLLSQTFRVRDDAAIRFDALTSNGLQYQIRSTVPSDTFASLASTNGEFSPMFQAATEDGRFAGQPDPATRPRLRPENISVFLDLPSDLDERIPIKAAEVTQNGATDFERALLLEQFYRDSGEFVYSVDIDPGHSATDLAAWLFEPESPNFRTGYCEQFSTGMAVMARALGIPSRVVLGFTPGDVGADGLITVRQRNAHAWIELWIDNHGWVRFDPTPRADGINPSTASDLGFAPDEYAIPIAPLQTVSDPRVDQPGEADAVPLFGPDQLPLDEFLNQLDQTEGGSGAETRGTFSLDVPQWVAFIPGLAILFSLAPLWKLVRRKRRLARLRQGSVEAAWSEIVDRLRDLDEPLSTGSTPLELADQVDDSLRPLATVVTKQTYAASSELSDLDVMTAIRSYNATEQFLTERSTRPQRWKALLRVTSLRAWR